MSGSAIAESELILTPKGTVYHLDLYPEQLADTVITVGDPGRVEKLTRYFDRIEHRARHREFVTHTGYLGSKRITVTGTGIGTDNIDIVLSELDALANIDLKTRMPKAETRTLRIIRLGTCGSVQADVPADSLVVSTHGIGLDNLLHYYEHDNSREEKDILHAFSKHTGLEGSAVRPYIAGCSADLLAPFSGKFIPGITVTCPGFFGPQGRVLRVPAAFPGLIDSLGSFSSGNNRITNFEMETSAIYGLGKALGHQCISINTVILNRVERVFSADADGAIDQMIRRSLEIIEQLT